MASVALQSAAPARTATRLRGVELPSNELFELCRTFGHAWDQFYPQNLERPPFGWRLSLRCTRCTTERHDIISERNGGIMGRRYYWADGYLMDRGVERPSREQLREDLFSRLRQELKANHQIAEAISAQTQGTAIPAKTRNVTAKTNGKARE